MNTAAFFHLAKTLNYYMRSVVGILGVVLFLDLPPTQMANCQEQDRERIAILPFTSEGLSADQGIGLRRSFEDALAQTQRFNILPAVAMQSILETAGVKKTDDCTTLPCIAQLGKILGVEKVVAVSVTHPGEGFGLHLQLVEASDASLVYEEKLGYQGSFDHLLSNDMPDLGHRLGTAKFGGGTRWYVIAAAAVVGVGIIYWIYTTFASTSTSQPSSTTPITSPQ